MLYDVLTLPCPVRQVVVSIAQNVHSFFGQAIALSLEFQSDGKIYLHGSGGGAPICTHQTNFERHLLH